MCIRYDMRTVFGSMCLTALLLICFFCTCLGISDKSPEMINILVLGVGSLYITLYLGRKCKSKLSFWILMSGYGIRLACLLVDLYGRDFITILHSGVDSEKFYRIACWYYQGDYSRFSTYYPYFLRCVFEIFGQNRFIVQYVNVFCWFLTAVLVIKICDLFEIPEKKRVFAYMVFAFWVNYIFLSSILMRESIMIFLDTCSFFYFIRWMWSGKKMDLCAAFLLVIPPVILHIASIALWAAYLFIMAVWYRKKQKIIIYLQKWMKPLILLLIGGMLFYCMGLKEFVLSYTGGFSLYEITHREWGTAGSQYLINMDCRYWGQFFPFTIIRMFYFIFSPLPMDMRGLGDLLAFLCDSLPIFLLTVRICWNIRKKIVKGYVVAGLLCCVLFVVIFAWGTGAAGTAMRHRTLMIGIWTMTYVLSIERKTEKRIG